MRVLFMGTPDFAVPSLRKLWESGYEIIGVVTQPDRPKGRKMVLTPSPVKEFAVKHNLPVFQPVKVKNEEIIEHFRRLAPDIIITVAFGQILPKSLLEIPTYGSINVHASLLPAYRGAAPIHWAVINGEEKTGITIMYMIEKLDAGDMLAVQSISISETDTTGIIHDQLKELGADLLVRTLPLIKAGKINPIRQDESKVTYAPILKREHEKIDWNNSAKNIYNQIRGLNPWPVAYTTLNGEVLKIWQAEYSLENVREEPGTILNYDDKGIIVATASGYLRIKELQLAGKKILNARDFVNGIKLKIGTKLGE